MSKAVITWGPLRTITLEDGPEVLEITVSPPSQDLLALCQAYNERLSGYYPDRTAALANYVAYHLPGARVESIEHEVTQPPPDAVP